MHFKLPNNWTPFALVPHPHRHPFFLIDILSYLQSAPNLAHFPSYCSATSATPAACSHPTNAHPTAHMASFPPTPIPFFTANSSSASPSSSLVFLAGLLLPPRYLQRLVVPILPGLMDVHVSVHVGPAARAAFPRGFHKAHSRHPRQKTSPLWLSQQKPQEALAQEIPPRFSEPAQSGNLPSKRGNRILAERGVIQCGGTLNSAVELRRRVGGKGGEVGRGWPGAA